MHIRGTSNWEDLAGSDVVIVTAGVPRKPGMSRDDLLAINLKIMRDIAENLKRRLPRSLRHRGLEPARRHGARDEEGHRLPGPKVVGMAGILDSARFQLFLAREAGVAVKDVRAMVLGGHGETMVPVLSYCTINGIPVRQLITQDRLRRHHRAHARRRRRGGQAHGLERLLRARRRGRHPDGPFLPLRREAPPALRGLPERRVRLPATSTWGCRSVIGASGVEKVIVIIELDATEKQMLRKSAAAVRELIEVGNACRVGSPTFRLRFLRSSLFISSSLADETSRLGGL